MRRNRSLAPAAVAVLALAIGLFLFESDREPAAPRAEPAPPIPEAPAALASPERAETPPASAPEVAPQRPIGGRLEIGVRDGAGHPLEGVEVELLPPIVAGDDWTAEWRAESEATRPVIDQWTGSTRRSVTPARRFDREAMGALPPAEWIRKTGAEGRVAWSGLDPAAGYRFGIRSAAAFARLSPPHEAERPPLGLSGTFSIDAGAETILSATLFGPATVRGTLVAENGDAVPGAEVRLVRVAHREREGGPAEREIRRDGETAVRSGEGGAFEFANAEPGRKEIAAFYEWPRGHYHCLAFPFELAPGETLDLGRVGTAGRHTVEGIVRYVGQNGEPVAVADLFEPAEAPLFQGIAFGCAEGDGLAKEDGPLPPPYAIRIEVEMERPFFVHGLSEGRLTSSPPYAVGTWPRLREPVRFAARGAAGIAVPAEAPIVIAISALPFAVGTLFLELPPDAPPQDVAAHLLPASGGRRIDVEWATGEAGPTRVRLAAPPGRYRLLVHAEPSAGSPGGESYWAEREIDVENEAEVRVEMRLAAAVTGVVRAGEREWPRDASVALGFDPWIDEPDDGWPYRAAIDRRGRFTVRGLPPHRRIAVRGAEETVETGAPGEEREFSVTIP